MKFTTFGLASIASAAVLGLVGCAQPSNPSLMAPPAKTELASDAKPIETTAVFQPKVDILFVIDNSASMQNHIDNLAGNPEKKIKGGIDRFVEAFKKNERVDFQIGVTSVHDSIRYGSVVKNFHPLGALYPVKRADGSTTSLNFVTRQEPDYTKVLAETLKIGTLPLRNAAGEDVGPENEEIFSPVLAALNGQNIGFPRADAHLAVVMITDADDVSSIEPSKLVSDLVRLKGNDASMVSAFAVLARTCSKVDPGIKGKGPAKILNLIEKEMKEMNARAYDLCGKGYGEKLAEAGDLIAKKATKTVLIPLESRVALDASGKSTLKVVFYEAKGSIDSVERSRICANGTNEIGRNGVYHDTRAANQVVVPGTAMEGKPASTTIQICYEKANMAKAGSSWLTPESAALKAKLAK